MNLLNASQLMETKSKNMFFNTECFLFYSTN